jgi:hypothetical protein
MEFVLNAIQSPVFKAAAVEETAVAQDGLQNKGGNKCCRLIQTHTLKPIITGLDICSSAGTSPQTRLQLSILHTAVVICTLRNQLFTCQHFE